MRSTDLNNPQPSEALFMNSQWIGRIIAQRYTVQSLLGRGGMGAVYRAKDARSGNEVALKIIRPEFSADPKTRRRFNKEARAFSYLKHANIVGIHDFGQDREDGTLYLVMELIEGISLRVLRHVSLPLFQLINIIDQLLGALTHAHARGVIHRDLKPENVLVLQHPETHEPIVKLVDFGLAMLPANSGAMVTQNGALIGTPSYMAPEQARGARGVVGPTSDIYAVGVILYELICDRLPFEAESNIDLIIKHVQSPVPALVPRKGLTPPPKVEEIIRRAMAKKPWDRFVNAAAFRKELKLVSLSPEPMPLIQLPPAPEETVNPSAELSQERKRSRRVAHSARPSNSSTFPKIQHNSGGIKKSGSQVSYHPQRPISSTSWRPNPNTPSPSSTPNKSSISNSSVSNSSVSNSSSSLLKGFDEGKLIGREEERSLLGRIYEEALGGRGQIVIIDGEQGVGKSRLVHSTLQRFAEEGLARQAVGFYSAMEGGGIHIGIRGAIESLFGTSDFDRSSMEQQTRGVLERLGVYDARDQEEITSYLRPKISEQNALIAGFSGESLRRHRNRTALTQRLLRLLAREVPLILLLEDIHWSNDGAMGFLESMASSFRLHPMPCVIICTLVNEEMEPSSAAAEGLRRLSRFEGNVLHRVHLSRLSKTDTAELLNQALPLDLELAQQLAERSAGNPLYALQLLHDLRQEKRLQLNKEKRNVLREGLSIAEVLPNSIAEVLRRRIARAHRRFGQRGEVFMEILIRVAVLGNSCDVALLEGYLSNEEDKSLSVQLDDALDGWVKHRILQDQGTGEGDMISFDHNMIRDVLLEDVPKRRLRRLHLRAAHSKRDHFYPALGPVAREIGEHFRAANQLNLASEYTLLAARISEVSGHFSEASELYHVLNSTFLRLETEANAKGQKSGLLSIPLDWSEVWLGLGRIAIHRGDYDGAEPFVNQLLSYAEARNLILPQARANWLKGQILTRKGELVEAWEHYNLARDLHEVEEDMTGVAQCLWGSGDVARRSGWLDDARGFIHGAIQIFEKNNRLVDVASCHLALGRVDVAGGLLLDAYGRFDTARRIFARTSDQHQTHYCTLESADLDRKTGKVRKSQSKLKNLPEIFALLGDREGQAKAHQAIGEAHMQLGQTKQAIDSFKEAIGFYQDLSDDRGASHVHRIQATLMRWSGDIAKAIQHLSEAITFFDKVDDRQGLAACYLERAMIALELEDPKRASEHLEFAHELYELSSDAIGITLCAEVCAQIEFIHKRHDQALMYIKQGLDLAEQTGALMIQARLLSLAFYINVEQKDYSSLRRVFPLLKGLKLDLTSIGEPLFQRNLRDAIFQLRRGVLEPDIRGIARRLERMLNREVAQGA